MTKDLFTKYNMTLKLVGVLFVGMHVPLVLAALVWLGTGQSDPVVLLMSVLFGTVAGLLISIGGIWSLLQSRGIFPA